MRRYRPLGAPMCAQPLRMHRYPWPPRPPLVEDWEMYRELLGVYYALLAEPVPYDWAIDGL